jgi:hypothetical protein
MIYHKQFLGASPPMKPEYYLIRVEGALHMDPRFVYLIGAGTQSGLALEGFLVIKKMIYHKD